MGKAKAFRVRRIRRQKNAAVKFGESAKPRHNLKSGRTGSAHAKKTKSSKIAVAIKPIGGYEHVAPSVRDKDGVAT